MTDEAEERQRHRALLLAVNEAALGRTDKVVDIRSLGRQADLSEPQVAAARSWLVGRHYLENRSFSGVVITSAGVDWLRTSDDPSRRAAEVASASTINLVNVHGDFNGPLHQGSGASSSASTSPVEREGCLRGLTLNVVGGLIAAIIMLFITGTLTDWFGLAGDDGGDGATSTTTSTVASDGDESCALGPCSRLTVQNTFEDGRYKGAYVRSTPFEDGQRRTGASEGTVVYAICRFDSGFEAMAGQSMWVKSPFDFVEGDVDATGRFPNPRSQPNPSSTTYGWINAGLLGPAEAIDALPPCDPSHL